MSSSIQSKFASLGLLRQGLIVLAFVTMLLPIIEWLIIQLSGELSEHSLFALSAGLIAPVMAPIILVVLLLDIIMSKVKAADDPENAGELYKMVTRVDTGLIFLMLLFWIPFFVLMMT